MDWQTAVTGVVLIVGLAVLRIWQLRQDTRRAARFRERHQQRDG
jgi:hypothetical protein